MKLDYNRIDPELREGATEELALRVDRAGLNALREALAAAPSAVAEPPVITRRHEVEAKGVKTTVFLYRKSDRPDQPCLLWFHGGGYVLGDADDNRAKQLAFDLDITVASVDYRLAPEHPFPGGLEDAWNTLLWLHGEGDRLGINPDCLAIGGTSAGAGLAAGLALKVRDAQGPRLKLQLLLYPMIDNLHATESGQIDNHPVWNQATSFAAWEMYLGGEPGDAASCYAAAARADDLSHLTPAHICVGTEDLFYDEDVDYARRLNAAGVPCELAVFPGLYHAGDVYHPQARVSQRLMASVKLALAQALGVAGN
ncbi:alpha/beta hydrolase [Pseudomonadales bacterium]|nr:alpha/beta hydrolase [Pseudomonadales bacterium]